MNDSRQDLIPLHQACNDSGAEAEFTEHHPRAVIIRDGFSMPDDEYNLIRDIKARCLAAGIVASKSGILRAALKALSQLPPDELVRLMEALPPVKTGRPSGQKKP